jgi:hypothetical protein
VVAVADTILLVEEAGVPILPVAVAVQDQAVAAAVVDNIHHIIC